MNEITMKLRNTPPKKLFLSYLIPSVFGMFLMAINVLADGIFVSHGVGPDALAAVNITVPVYSILFSISLWIGMGGATLYSISLGQNDIKKARSVFTQSFVLALAIVGVLVAISLWKETEMAYLFGANDEILGYVTDYMHIILVFGIIYVLENILSIFIRNDGNPKLAMFGLVTTSVLNIIFNYIFIFVYDFGIKGAAYATILSTVFGLGVLLTHFLKKNRILAFAKLHFERPIISEILKIGLPSFIVEATAAVVIVAYNLTFMHFAGQDGVTSFAVVNYLHTVFLMLFLGVGAAIQPIVSFHFGAALYERMKYFLSLAIKTGIGLGLIVLIIGWLFGDYMVALFGITDEKIVSFTLTGISYFFIGYIFLAYNLIYVEYFQSIKKIRLSIIIVLIRSVILFLPLLWLLPTLFGADFIWLAFPIAEALTAGLLLIGHRVLSSLSIK